MPDSRSSDLAEPPRTVVPVAVVADHSPGGPGSAPVVPVAWPSPRDAPVVGLYDIETAVGVVMECLGVDAETARSIIDACAAAHGVPLAALSRWIVQDLSGVATAHSHVVAAFLSDPFRPGPRTEHPTFRIVDVDGHVLYRPTDDACELVRQVGATSGEALVQVQGEDGSWTDGRGRCAGLLGLVTLEPTVVLKVDAAALVDPMVSADGAVWRMALLDRDGMPLVEGTLPPRAEDTPDVRLAERVLRGLGLQPSGEWVEPPPGGRPFYVARVKTPRLRTAGA